MTPKYGKLVAYFVLVLMFFLCFRSGAAQDDFSDPIKCYQCNGSAENSSCADPLDDVSRKLLKEIICDHGICLKWTKYSHGVLQMVRTCSEMVKFQLTMVDGVCRTERNGNGQLCMCGKSLCNTAPSQLHTISSTHWVLSAGLAVLLVKLTTGLFTDNLFLVR